MITPIKAIRAKCLECTEGQTVYIRLCSAVGCPLWDCRMGSKPTSSPLYDKELFREHADLRASEFSVIIDALVEQWKQAQPKRKQPEHLKRG